ncbi:MAG: hypothetical protein LBB50_01850 [Oscillospiraceae bacterium]|jgi:hypothetical protein|nr:hypothetical protein [Oscillospiraceae bacterium]
MNEIETIKDIMERFGRQVFLCLPDGWQSARFGAFLQPLRYKNKMYLGGVNTRIGFNREGYYLYLGPPAHDLSQLPREMWIQCGAERYTVDRTEVVHFAQTPSHVWAIVRSMVE